VRLWGEQVRLSHVCFAHSTSKFSALQICIYKEKNAQGYSIVGICTNSRLSALVTNGEGPSFHGQEDGDIAPKSFSFSIAKTGRFMRLEVISDILVTRMRTVWRIRLEPFWPLRM
jgi:hypothetical protein